MTRHFFVVLLIVATSCGSTHIERGESFGRHPSFATTTAPPTSALPAPATTTTSSSSSVPILVGPAPLSPSEQVEEVLLPSNVDGSATGLGGQIRATAFGPQGDFGWGLSYYTALWDSFPSVPPNGALTASGTWLIPDNWRYSETLCPEGTFARDSLTDRGPSYREVFQTIEGGVGHWNQTRFPSPQPKFRLIGNVDCYTTDSSNPGWAWSKGDELVPGLVQLSNRIIVPPDGITFEPQAGALIGAAWLALPLSEPYERNGLLVGDKSWTLFLESANFRGPVAYWTPESWSSVTENHPPSQLRGLDHRPIDTEYRIFAAHLDVPSVSTNESDDNWFRIPQIEFPVDGQGRTIFHQDVTFYGQGAVYDQVKGALDGGQLPLTVDSSSLMHAPLQTHRWGLQSDGKEVVGLERFVALEDWDTDEKEGWAWGLQWPNRSGVFPSYFRESGNEWQPVDTSEAPSQLQIPSPFAPATRKSGYAPPLDDGPLPRVSVVTLNDGSVVRYTWYRFVDQPAIAALGLSESQKERLQDAAERIHAQWNQQAIFIQPPSEGTLVEVQGEVLVTPPKGAEVGWVPVVISQTASQ